MDATLDEPASPDSSVASDPAGQPDDAAPTRPARGWAWVELLVLTSFAMSQPLLSLVGANPTFLVAHDLSGWQVVAYAIAIVVVPWIAVVVVEEVANAVLPAARQVVWVVLRAALLGVTVAGPANQALDLDGLVAVIVIGLAIALAAVALVRLDRLRLVIRVAVFAPLAFLGGFIWLSPAATLIGSDEVAGTGAADNDIPVVWVLFDQFPSSMMVDHQGELRDEWFPNFARLADMSTWYTSATTVAPQTATATTSALTGRFADPDAPPVAAVEPDNLFTLLAGSHDVVAMENVTQLCPETLCATSGEVHPVALARDTRTLLVRTVLPDSVADRLVPEIGTRWAFFDDTAQVDGSEVTRFSGDDRERVAEFMAQVRTMGADSLRYLHLERPHEALLFLPDGRTYDQCSCYRLADDVSWPEAPEMARQRLQRYVLQAMSADTVLGQVLDELEDGGRLEDTMVVVMSDHGASLLPGTPNRVVTPETGPDVLPVPMFIKYPGSDDGVMDARDVQVTDLLPTVLDVLDGEVPDDLDGQSLAGSGPVGPVTVIEDSGATVELEAAPKPTDSALVGWLDQLFPDATNPYSFGPHADLYGRDPTPLVGDAAPLEASIATLDRLATVDVDAANIPAHVVGELTGSDEPVELVAAVNGRIAGMGTTFDNDSWQVSIMVDPTMLVDGANELALYAVDGATLHPVAVANGAG